MISSIILLWGALPNLKGLVKCALWGLRGRTLTSPDRVGLLIKFLLRSFRDCEPRTGNVLTSTFDVSPSQVIRASGLVEAPRSSFLIPFVWLLRLLLFLGRNMIFHQNKTVEHFHIGQFVQWHIIKFFRNFYAIHRTKRTCKALTFESQKGFPSIFLMIDH